MKHKLVFSFILISICFQLSKTQAQGMSYNQEFQVNSYTMEYQEQPVTSNLSDGGFVVCWTSNKQDGSGYGVFCQLFESNGSKRGSEFQVNTHSTNWQWYPSVSGLIDGGFVICWMSGEQDGSENGIFGQLFENNGNKRGTEFQVNTFTKNSQWAPTVCGLSNSGFVICWVSIYQDGISQGSIWSQIYESNGNKKGTEFKINLSEKRYYWFPQVCKLSDGGFVVCWTTDIDNGYTFDTCAQIFNSDGTRRSSEFQIHPYTTNWRTDPKITDLTDGGFVITWTCDKQDGKGKRAFCQIFDAYGVKRNSEIQLNMNNHNSQYKSNISGLSENEFVACWLGSSLNGDIYIFCQLFDTYGNKKGPVFHANTSTDYWLNSPIVSRFSNDKFALIWESMGQDGSGNGIYGKYYLQQPIIHQLEDFSLIEPTDDQTLISINFTFKWNMASSTHINLPWELEYTLYLDEDDSFSSPTIIDSIYDTTYTVQNLTPGTTYFWEVLAKNIAGDSLWSSETNAFFVSHDATSIQYLVSKNPKAFKLYANYPNPFNPETTIKYNLPADQSVYPVKVKIYDALGRLIVTLKDALQNPGLHTVKWNGKNTTGQSMPSGIYFCVVEAGQFKASQKMLLVR